MATMKDDVLAALAKVASPQGQTLTETGTLSDVVVTDGKVFFSISVDAGAVKEWESVRARAEAATRAVPGVKSVLVALTAERASGVGGTAPQRRPQMPPAAGAAARGRNGAVARRHSRRRLDHRGGVGQRRRRQIDHRGQSGAGLARPRPESRHFGCRHLWAVDAKATRPSARSRRPSAATD